MKYYTKSWSTTWSRKRSDTWSEAEVKLCSWLEDWTWSRCRAKLKDTWRLSKLWFTLENGKSSRKDFQKALKKFWKYSIKKNLWIYIPWEVGKDKPRSFHCNPVVVLFEIKKSIVLVCIALCKRLVLHLRKDAHTLKYVNLRFNGWISN